MIANSESSSSNTEIKDNKAEKHSKIGTLYVIIMCFATNCLSSVALEAGSHGSFRSISLIKPAVLNNLFAHAYNLRIKTLITNVLMAAVSTIMLTIGDIYGIPYLYLPWLVNTMEGMALYEGPTLFGLAYTVLPNANVSAGLFIFITLFIYVEELCIWKDVLVGFAHCWKNYNKNKKLQAEAMAITNKQLCMESEGNFEVIPKKSGDLQESLDHCSNSDNKDYIKPTMKSAKSEFSIRNRHSENTLFITG